MTDVVALGELLIDFACLKTDADGYPTMAAHPGGAPANFLAALSKFGAKTALIGKVGTDAFGKILTETLKKAGIETRGLVTADDVFTTLAFVTFDAHGDREFSFSRKPGADTRLTFDELELSLIDEARVFHFGTLSLTDEPARSATYKAVAYAKEKGKLITCDPNLRKPLWQDLAVAKKQLLWAISQADVVKISDEEIPSPFCLEPDIVYTLNETAIDTYESRLKPGGVLLVNSSLVPDERTYRDDIQVIKVPATTIADELGNPKGTNIVMLGALACASDLYDEAAMRHAVEHYFGKKGKVNPKNAQCFDRGADEARKQL
mgnify:CR=1 FL=1